MGHKIELFSNTFLLLSHVLIYTGFQFLPPFSSGPDNKFVNTIRSIFESFSKTKLISKAIETAKITGNDHFFFKVLISLCSTQFNKYLFERFLIQSRESNNDYRNYSMALCLLIFSSNHITDIFSIDHQLIATSTVILFMGNYLDSSGSKKVKVRPKKQGQIKLRSNAKA